MATERRGIAIKRKEKTKVSEQTVTATGTAARGEGLTERVTAESGVDWKRAPLSWWRWRDDCSRAGCHCRDDCSRWR
ncbi:hypothetical protein P8452_43562 [Trifolium repens]|nr:hypothetical protein P8452_43562 [Trifolium repens]